VFPEEEKGRGWEERRKEEREKGQLDVQEGENLTLTKQVAGPVVVGP
jgi:hypothetical protein